MTKKKMENNKNAESFYNKLVEYALRISMKKRYTSVGMRNKLFVYAKKRKVNFEEEENADEVVINRVMDRLTELRYLDDEKYARDFVEERMKMRPRGKFLLKRELKSKGISEEKIEAAVTDSNIDEFESALGLLSKKSRFWDGLPMFQKRNKAFQFLASKGFNRDAIYRAVDSCYNRSVDKDLN